VSAIEVDDQDQGQRALARVALAVGHQQTTLRQNVPSIQ
jgi:hypothetical protein